MPAGGAPPRPVAPTPAPRAGSKVKHISPPEAQLGYLVTAIIVVVAGSIILAIRFVSHELRPEPRRSPMLGRSRAARRVGAGDGCVCGGTIGRSGRISKRFGELLGCTACNRLWTMDGRRIRRRRPRYAGQAPGSAG